MLLNIFLSSAVLVLVSTPIYLTILYVAEKRREERKLALQKVIANRRKH